MTLERQLAAGVVADRGLARALEEPVHAPGVVLEVRAGPGVVGVGGPQRGELERRVAAAGGVRLEVARRRAEALRLDFRREPVVVVERAVLLAGDHEVANRRVVAAAPAPGGRGRRGPDRPPEDGRARGAGPAQERLTREGLAAAHTALPLL